MTFDKCPYVPEFNGWLGGDARYGGRATLLLQDPAGSVREDAELAFDGTGGVLIEVRLNPSSLQEEDGNDSARLGLRGNDSPFQEEPEAGRGAENYRRREAVRAGAGGRGAPRRMAVGAPGLHAARRGPRFRGLRLRG